MRALEACADIFKFAESRGAPLVEFDDIAEARLVSIPSVRLSAADQHIPSTGDLSGSGSYRKDQVPDPTAMTTLDRSRAHRRLSSKASKGRRAGR